MERTTGVVKFQATFLGKYKKSDPEAVQIKLVHNKDFREEDQKRRHKKIQKALKALEELAPKLKVGLLSKSTLPDHTVL